MAQQLLPHTAAATWSGFIYQGRVGLYHVMKLLNEKNSPELDGLYLQIDSIEDFSIIEYDNNGKVVPITMHQVKAVKSSLYSTYKEDFEQLENKKTATENGNVQAFFHLSVQNEQTKAQIGALHPQISIYCYENDEEFCPLNGIDNKIKNQLALVLQKYHIVGHDNMGNVEILYDLLEKIISDKIIYIHSLNHNGTAIRKAAFENTVLLSTFLDTIRLDITTIIQNEQYFETKIRANLNRYYQEYCVEVDNSELAKEVKAKMDCYLCYFNAFSSAKFKSFLQSIRPHKEIRFTNLQEFTDYSLQQDEIKDTFLVILTEINESNNNQGIGWICSSLKNYYPTSITISDSAQSKKKISERILNTAISTMVDVPFDSDYLITSECNVESIQLSANKISEVEELDNNKIINWKNLALIDLETAKYRLNG
jgi:hypothetical protein